jgi:pimeloyl-ACP methyl ester carboxylesterase
MNIRFRLLLTILACITFIALAGGYTWLDRWQRETIFSVELGESRWWREAPHGTEVFDIALSNGDTVRAWYLAQADSKAPTVLYLHGSRWNLNSSIFRMERWASMGYSILAIDYRGFGESTSIRPSQASAVKDARAAMEELALRQPDPALRFIYGHSLGGAIAVALAEQLDQSDFSGLILESTFTSIRDMLAGSRWASIPGLALLITQPFDSLSGIKAVENPILLLHGTEDRVVPHTMSDALLAAANDATRIVKIEGASHSGASRDPEYQSAVQGFIRDASAAKAGI